MGWPAQAPFHLRVDTELILCGATEADATVRLGDQEVVLQPDGTFRLRFALPDGAHRLSLSATSARTGEKRAVDLLVSRRTQNP
jgi:hypothetical protein